MNHYTSDIKEIKYEVLTKVAKLAFEDTLEDKKDDIAYEIIPGTSPRFRCCVYKEREIIRERVALAMGKRKGDKIVNILNAACEGCPINRFSVTENCQKCMAKNCVNACPFNAIDITAHGAYIDQSKCRECGRCAAACPYNAIADLMRPCKRSCPVDAISMDSNKIAIIKEEKCIECGACTNACPFGAISDVSFMVNVIALLKSSHPVYAIFAPAIEGQFGPDVTIGMIKSALLALGFTDTVEVALGADAVSKHEGEELSEAVKNGRKMTTSCCPAFVNMIKKHYPNLLANMSTTVSPMVATARYIKTIQPKSKVVFIGPCIAKKGEAVSVPDSGVDYVLTFEEIFAMFSAKEINFQAVSENGQDGSIFGKNFAKNGGVTDAVLRVFAEKNQELPISCKRCNGAEECKKALLLLKSGKLPEGFVEGMACENGCIGGPATIVSPVVARKSRDKLIAEADKVGIHENLQKHDFSKVKMTR